MKISIFIHAAILSRIKERIEQYLNIIYTSKLSEQIDKIFINFIGSDNIPEINSIIDKNKIIIESTSKNLNDFEIPTQMLMYNYCLQNPDYKILYIHTKNVGKEINECIEDQIEYMLYFLIQKWEDCIKKLDNYKTVGVDLRDNPVLHYSGNFWWANASYIISLPSPIEYSNLLMYPNPLNSERHNQEFWICYNKEKIHYSIHDCCIDVYSRHLVRYEKYKYI